MGIKICTDATLDWNGQLEAAERAREETYVNTVQNPTILSDAIVGGFDLPPLSAVLLVGKQWEVGRELSIAFMDGGTSLQSRVIKQAEAWLEFANVKLRWGVLPASADIRITFTRGGSWSYIGTDNLVVKKDKPTMQLGWLDDNTDDVELRRVVKHEFGHMFGLGHEHQHPEGHIPWNKTKVYEYYKATNGWSKSEVDQQVFKLYSNSQTNHTVYDPHSIMHYAIPAELLTDASKVVGWNTDLSDMDKQFMVDRYPYPSLPPVKPLPKHLDWLGDALKSLQDKIELEFNKIPA